MQSGERKVLEQNKLQSETAVAQQPTALLLH